MTDKELHKLSRRELLQLMLAQGREAERAKEELAETLVKLGQLEEGYERLKRRLDDKDAQIHQLREALQAIQDDPDAFKGELSASAAPLIPVPDDYYKPPIQQEQTQPGLQSTAVQQAGSAKQDPASVKESPKAQPAAAVSQEPAAFAPQQEKAAVGDTNDKEKGMLPGTTESKNTMPAYDETSQKAARPLAPAPRERPQKHEDDSCAFTETPSGIRVKRPANVQMLQAVQIVNGRVVSHSRVTRPKYQ